MNTPSETKKNSIGQAAVRSAAWMLSAAWLMSILQLIVLVVLSRTLQPSDFGLMAAALVVLGFGDIFANLGVGAALIQRDEIRDSQIAAAFWSSLLFGSGVSAVVYGASPILAAAFAMPDLTHLLELAAISYVLKAMAVVPTSLLQRDMRFRETAFVEMIAYAVGYSLVAFICALNGMGAASLVAGVLAQAVIRLSLLWMRAPARFCISFSAQDLKDVLLFGGGITLSAIFNYAARNADNAVIGRILGDTALGLYGRSYRLMTTSVTLVAKILDKVLFSALSREKDLVRSANTYRTALGLIASALLPFSAFTGIFASEIVIVVLGPGWDGAVVPFQVLCAGMIFRTSYKVSGALARAQGAVYQIAWRNGVYAATVCVAATLGALSGNLEMVAAGVLVALFLFFVLMTDLCVRLLPVSWFDVALSHLRAAAFAGIVGAPLFGARVLFFDWRLPPIAMLGLGAVLFCLISLGLIAVRPHLALGRDACGLLVRSVGYVVKNRFGIQVRLARLLQIQL